MKSQLIIDVQWLCQFLIAPVMSDDSFPISIAADLDGVVSIEQIAEVLEDYNETNDIPIDAAVTILRFLGLC